VIKQFDLIRKELIFNDCGLLAELEDGRLVTSQWVDPDYAVEAMGTKLTIRGVGHNIPVKLFTPVKFILFRIFMLAFGWNTWVAYQIKGLIRKLLMTQAKSMPLQFNRAIEIQGEDLIVTDTIELEGGARVRRLLIGDEMPIRYVPQSRYFQPQELDVLGWMAPDEFIDKLNNDRKASIRRSAKFDGTIQLMNNKNSGNE
jgi:hypothetical protein